MVNWIADNIASIVLLLLVASIVFFLLRSRIKQRKQGSCGCGCEGCRGCTAHNRGGKI